MPLWLSFRDYFGRQNTGENKVAPGNAKMNKINNLKTLKKNIGINVIL